MSRSPLLSCWLVLSLSVLHAVANPILKQTLSAEPSSTSPQCESLPLPDDLVENEIFSKLPLEARINFSLINRKIWKDTAPYRLFDRVFRNSQYDPDYLENFQSLLPILEDRQDLCQLVTPEDIVRAYDRLMRSADPNPSQIIDPKVRMLIRRADILEQQLLAINPRLITDNMNNLIKILDNKDLEILVQGLYLSDALLIDNVSKVSHLIRKRIRLLIKSGRYDSVPNLSSYLITFGKLTRDPGGEQKMRGYMSAFSSDFHRAAVLALLECGLRFNLLSISDCGLVSKAFPFLRYAWLEGPEQGRHLHKHLITWYAVTFITLNRYHSYIPAVLSHICRHISEFIVKGSFFDMALIGLTILREKGPVVARKVFNTVGSDGSTLLHRVFDKERRGTEAYPSLSGDGRKVTAEEMKKLLSVPGLHINAQDRRGQTVLHLAVINKSSIDVVTEILSYSRIDPHLPNNKDKTPQCLAEELRLNDHVLLLPEDRSLVHKRKIFDNRFPC